MRDLPQGRELSPESFAKVTDTPVETVWSWIHKRSTRGIDERDLRRYTQQNVKIIYQLPDAAGKGGRPRMITVPRKTSVHKSRGAAPVDIDTIEALEALQEQPIEGITVYRRARR